MISVALLCMAAIGQTDGVFSPLANVAGDRLLDKQNLTTEMQAALRTVVTSSEFLSEALRPHPRASLATWESLANEYQKLLRDNKGDPEHESEVLSAIASDLVAKVESAYSYQPRVKISTEGDAKESISVAFLGSPETRILVVRGSRVTVWSLEGTLLDLQETEIPPIRRLVSHPSRPVAIAMDRDPEITSTFWIEFTEKLRVRRLDVNAQDVAAVFDSARLDKVPDALSPLFMMIDRDQQITSISQDGEVVRHGRVSFRPSDPQSLAISADTDVFALTDVRRSFTYFFDYGETESKHLERLAITVYPNNLAVFRSETRKEWVATERHGVDATSKELFSTGIGPIVPIDRRDFVIQDRQGAQTISYVANEARQFGLDAHPGFEYPPSGHFEYLASSHEGLIATAFDRDSIVIWSRPKNPFAPILVKAHTDIVDKTDVPNYRVHFVEKALKGTKRFRTFNDPSSPTEFPITAGHYEFWASKDGSESASIPFTVSAKLNPVVRIPVK